MESSGRGQMSCAAEDVVFISDRHGNRRDIIQVKAGYVHLSVLGVRDGYAVIYDRSMRCAHIPDRDSLQASDTSIILDADA